MTDFNPSTEDFAALLEESFVQHDLYEGAVVKGTVVAIEKDLAVIDVTPQGFAVREIIDGLSFDDLQAMTGAPLIRQSAA